MQINRRAFLQGLAGLTAGLLLPDVGRGQEATRAAATQPGRDRLGEVLPQRRLGRTGAAVTMLGVGGWHIGQMSEAEAQKTIEVALAGGVRFFDSAQKYQNGGSESRLGKLLTPRYRDVVFLMTKTMAHDAASARRDLDDALRRMRIDHLDLWQMHEINSPEDTGARLKNGVLDVMLDAQARGKVRFIGFTGHANPAAHRDMLGRMRAMNEPLQTCQMPVNLADPSYNSFTLGVLPTLVERGYGVLAMKTLSNGGFFGGSDHGKSGDNPKLVPDRVSIADALHFAWSLPISVLITGPNDAAQMQEKIDAARSFQGMTEERRRELIAKVADLAGRRVEFYKD